MVTICFHVHCSRIETNGNSVRRLWKNAYLKFQQTISSCINGTGELAGVISNSSRCASRLGQRKLTPLASPCLPLPTKDPTNELPELPTSSSPAILQISKLEEMRQRRQGRASKEK